MKLISGTNSKKMMDGRKTKAIEQRINIRIETTNTMEIKLNVLRLFLHRKQTLLLLGRLF